MKLPHHLKIFLSGSLITIVGNIVLGLVNYLVRRLMVCRLNETDYGLFWGTFSMIAIFSVFADMGMGNAGAVLIAEDRERQSEIFSTVFWLKVLTGFIAGCVFFVVRSFFSKTVSGGMDMWGVFAVFLLLFVSNGSFSAYYQGNKLYRARSMFLCVPCVILLVLLWSLLPSGASATQAALIYTVTYAISVAVQFGYSSLRGVRWRFSRGILPRLFSLTGALVIVAAVQTVLFNMDSVMLTTFAGPRQVAVYNVALPLTHLLLSVMVFAYVFLPMAIEMIGQEQYVRLKKYISAALFATVLLLPCIFLGSLWGGKWLITLFFTDRYADAAAPLLPWLLCGYLLHSFGSFVSQTLIAMRRIRILTAIALMTLLGDIVLLYLLVGRFGAKGAAVATFCSFAFFALANWLSFMFSVTTSPAAPDRG